MLGELDGLLVVAGEQVAHAGDGAVHAGPAHLLQADLLPHDHLGHAGAAEIHRRVPLDHDDDVGEAGDVGTAGRAGAEEAADLGHLARERDLVVEDPPGAATTGEEVDLVGDAGAGGVDEPEDRQLLAQRRLGGPDDLLHGSRAPGAGLDRGVVGDDDRRPPVDLAPAGDHPVGGQPLRRGVGVATVLDEGALVEEQGDPVADVHLALGVELGLRLLRRTCRGRVGRLETLPQVLHAGVGVGVAHRPGSGARAAHTCHRAGPRQEGRPSPRAMTIRCTSEVPSPISRILASRKKRATGYSSMKPLPPKTWVAMRVAVTAASVE